MEDLQRYFRIEAQELVDALTRGLLDLERRGGGEVLDQCFRWAHTLKGAARTVKQLGIGELAHAIEDVLAPYRASGDPVPGGHVGELLRLVDAIRAELARAPGRQATASEAPGRAPEHERFETTRVELTEVGALADEIGEAMVQFGALRGGLDTLAVAERLAASLAEAPGDRPPASAAGARGGRARAVVDELRAALARARAEVSGGLDRLERELRQAQIRARELQLIAADTVLPSIELAVRDAAEALGKRVDFEATGGDIRLDGHVLAALREAMLHVARNAVDHGVEPPEERIRAGKLPAGHIRLRVERRGGRVAFICSDDGRGVDVDAVRRAAASAGLAPAEEVARLPADEALSLIFRPGVSTSAAITAISGRGVGLDVVRETATRLKGSARAWTEWGGGTTVEIVVPVSVSLISALRLEDAGREVLIPLDSVRGVLRLAEGVIVRGLERDAIVHEDQLVPFAPLAVLLGARRSAGWPLRAAVVVEVDGARVALGVEGLLGATDVIVKPLPGAAGAPAEVAGATFDAQGDPVLVLDPQGVIAAICAKRPKAPPPRGRAPLAPILIVDDSLTTRMLEQSILEAEGYEVELAASGEEGLRKAAERRYGLFLVDVQMPGMSGFELTERVRADPELREIPLIIVTSLTSAGDRRRGAEVGADAYIMKGEFDQRHLLRTVADLMGRHSPGGAA